MEPLPSAQEAGHSSLYGRQQQVQRRSGHSEWYHFNSVGKERVSVKVMLCRDLTRGVCVMAHGIRRRNIHTEGLRQEHASPFKTRSEELCGWNTGSSWEVVAWDCRKTSSV